METKWISGCLQLEEWVDLEVKASFFSYFRVNLDLQKSCDDNADSSYILQKKICSTINILHMYSVFDTINCPRSIAY